MRNKLDLMYIIKEMVTEVGDLKNIEPYPYKLRRSENTHGGSEEGSKFSTYNYEGTFTADINGESVDVLVWMDPSDRSEVGDFSISPIFNTDGQLYHIGFEVGEDDIQYTRTTMTSYSRILKTVADILKVVVIQNDSYTSGNNLYLIGSTSKYGVRGTDDGKLRYYRAILNYNIPPGYRMGEGTYMGMKAVVLQKIGK